MPEIMRKDLLPRDTRFLAECLHLTADIAPVHRIFIPRDEEAAGFNPCFFRISQKKKAEVIT